MQGPSLSASLPPHPPPHLNLSTHCHQNLPRDQLLPTNALPDIPLPPLPPSCCPDQMVPDWVAVLLGCCDTFGINIQGCLHILLSNSQAGLDRSVKQEQEEISRNLKQTIILLPVRRPDAEVLAAADVLQDHCALLSEVPPPPLGRRGSLLGGAVSVRAVIAAGQSGDDVVHLLGGVELSATDFAKTSLLS